MKLSKTSQKVNTHSPRSAHAEKKIMEMALNWTTNSIQSFQDGTFFPSATCQAGQMDAALAMSQIQHLKDLVSNTNHGVNNENKEQYGNKRLPGNERLPGNTHPDIVTMRELTVAQLKMPLTCPASIFLGMVAKSLTRSEISGRLEIMEKELVKFSSGLGYLIENDKKFFSGVAACIALYANGTKYFVTSSVPAFRYLTGWSSLSKTARENSIMELKNMCSEIARKYIRYLEILSAIVVAFLNVPIDKRDDNWEFELNCITPEIRVSYTGTLHCFTGQGLPKDPCALCVVRFGPDDAKSFKNETLRSSATSCAELPMIIILLREGFAKIPPDFIKSLNMESDTCDGYLESRHRDPLPKVLGYHSVRSYAAGLTSLTERSRQRIDSKARELDF